MRNNSNLPLPVAVWLAHGSGYDLKPSSNVISATSMRLPIKSLVLSRKVQESGLGTPPTLEETLPSMLGSAVHTAVEVAWKEGYYEAMLSLGIPESIVQKVRINPEPEDLSEDIIPVYIEKRRTKEIDGMIISGKFDIVIDGELHDVKTSKAYGFMSGSNDADYQMQGSIYRWLNSDIITSDYVVLNYLITDWSALQAQADKTYPQSACISKKVPLHSLAATEAAVREKLAHLKRYEDADQEEIPDCTPKELWQDSPVWAYYADANKTQRATKLFEVESDAYTRMQADGNKGLVVRRLAEPKRCRWCAANPICLQAEGYRQSGILKG